ncbi:MAG: PorT family protein, partial [Gemmatimonadota bacterium]
FETESTDFGVLFGGGIAFPAGPGDLFIEGRFNVGLRDIDTSTDTEAKHRSGAAMIGYSFSLGPIG